MKALTLPLLLTAVLAVAACQSLTTMGERPSITWTGAVSADTAYTYPAAARTAATARNEPDDVPEETPAADPAVPMEDEEEVAEAPWEVSEDAWDEMDRAETEPVTEPEDVPDVVPDGEPPVTPAPARAARLDRLDVATRQSLSALPPPLTGENKLGGTALRFRRSIPDDTPVFVPRTREGLDLLIADPTAEGWFAVYRGDCGGLGDVCRYRAVLFDRAGDERWDLDLNAFLAQEEQVEIQDARLHGGRVYFNEACATYAAEAGGDCSQLVRVDPEWREVDWRTPPLVSNNIFIFHDPYVVAGYGFTAEPDSLYLIDQQTGRIAARSGLDSAHEYLEIRDGKLYVVTYRSVYTFDL